MKKNTKQTVIAIVGPTGSGKTACALELAKSLGSEIISADSRQIYRELDIATAKPSIAQRQGIVHHFLDIIEPSQEYSVAEFAQQAKAVIENLFLQGKTPIVAGGTGLYFRILLENYEMPKVAPNKELRAELEKIAEEKGVETLYKMLLAIDPESAKKMHPNNTVKIIRAIEVSKTLEVPMSQAQKKKDIPDYNVLWLGLNSDDRQFLYDRTDSRVDKMIDDGLENEARLLLEKYGRIPSLLNTIAYQEFIEYFDGILPYDECVKKIKQNTRRYVKRQLTWFRRNKEINWFDVDDEDCLGKLCDFVVEYMK